MVVAHDAAFTKRLSAGQKFVGPIRRNLCQDERVPPTERSMPGRISGIVFQKIAGFGNGEGFVIVLKRPLAFLEVLRGVGGQADIRERAA